MSTDWMADAQAACGGICPEPRAHKIHTDGKHAYEACPHCGSDQPLARPKMDDHVMFSALRDPWGDDKTTVRIPGTVTRMWDKPATDPYVTIRSDDHRTFVRSVSTVTVIPAGAES
jgi:hypothetical protein